MILKMKTIYYNKIELFRSVRLILKSNTKQWGKAYLFIFRLSRMLDKQTLRIYHAFPKCQFPIFYFFSERLT